MKCKVIKDSVSETKENGNLSVLKRVLPIINYIVIVGNLIWIIGNYVSMCAGYYIEYPRLHLSSGNVFGYIILGLLILSPSIQSILNIILTKRNYYKEHFVKKLIISGSLLIITIILSAASSFITFWIIPPVESFTQNTARYLETKNDMKKYEKIYCNFFPQAIPSNATNIEYYYCKYSSVFSTDATIRASWTLPVRDYEESKQMLNDIAFLEPIDTDKYNVYIQGIAYPTELNLIVKYNDTTNTVVYTAIIGKAF